MSVEVRLIAVLRRPLLMVAVVGERTHPLCTDDSGDWRFGYRERVVPLAQLSQAVCPWRDKDVKAWRALAQVPRLEGRSALAIVRAILGSVADPQAVPPELPPLTGPSLDLRPHLCSPIGETLLLDRIAGHLEAATASLDFPDWHWRDRHEIAALPAEFRRSFLWGLHLSSWSMVQITVAAFEALDLGNATDLRLAVAMLLLRAERQVGLAWCEALADVAAPLRSRAAELLVENQLWRTRPDPSIVAAMAAADWASPYLRARTRE